MSQPKRFAVLRAPGTDPGLRLSSCRQRRWTLLSATVLRTVFHWHGSSRCFGSKFGAGSDKARFLASPTLNLLRPLPTAVTDRRADGQSLGTFLHAFLTEASFGFGSTLLPRSLSDSDLKTSLRPGVSGSGEFAARDQTKREH